MHVVDCMHAHHSRGAVPCLGGGAPSWSPAWPTGTHAVLLRACPHNLPRSAARRAPHRPAAYMHCCAITPHSDTARRTRLAAHGQKYPDRASKMPVLYRICYYNEVHSGILSFETSFADEVSLPQRLVSHSLRSHGSVSFSRTPRSFVRMLHAWIADRQCPSCIARSHRLHRPISGPPPIVYFPQTCALQVADNTITNSM